MLTTVNLYSYTKVSNIKQIKLDESLANTLDLEDQLVHGAFSRTELYPKFVKIIHPDPAYIQHGALTTCHSGYLLPGSRVEVIPQDRRLQILLRDYLRSMVGYMLIETCDLPES